MTKITYYGRYNRRGGGSDETRQTCNAESCHDHAGGCCRRVIGWCQGQKPESTGAWS